MIIAGPNLTIDRTSRIAELRPGEVLRVSDVAVTPGGKGLNVARAALLLRAPASLVGFIPGYTGRAAAAMIAEEGITLQGIDVAGEIRSTAIVLEPGGRATVLNEPGPFLERDGWVALEAVVDDDLADHGVLVCSGSLPPGAPEDGYGLLVARARDAGRRSVVDAAGGALAACLSAYPDVVVPNLGEAEGVLFGRVDEAVDAAPDARPRAERAALELVRRGAEAAVVTAAAAGAAVAWDGEPVWIEAPRVHVVNPIGAGDVLTAALAAALERGVALVEAVREGVAAASAAVEHPVAGRFDPARMRALLR
ncbi:PfkB family carbohydrate kinase [Solirubrobacter ginsenosidimutans]|uniref:PfkB family carbohydrate kinase n=1 Tax=Solirubrobacter ginsenosidimutans TaxID=490573 RepID=A0A9X3MZ33_9ACTN|nr:PfkB family carbohydrate kinase [Solirubrobacter ginsenosidimutans]MDA0163925.1 PfkB family carbohydrate kinase [Solirubrobacter ginsenosidimutans]